MGIFWPLLAVIIGFSLFEYVKKLKPERVKKTTIEDQKRMLVLSTMSAFLWDNGGFARRTSN